MAAGLSITKPAYSTGGEIRAVPKVIFISSTVDPKCIVQHKTISAGDYITYRHLDCIKDGGGAGSFRLNTDGIPEITGGYGTYGCTFKFNGGEDEVEYVGHGDYADLLALFTIQPQDADGWTIFTPEADSRLLFVDNTEPNDTTAGPSANSSDYYTLSTLPNVGDWQDPGAVNAYQTIEGARADARDNQADWILLLEDQTHLVTTTFRPRAGNSNTKRARVGAYGPNGNRAKISTTDVTITALVEFGSSVNYSDIFSIDVHPLARDYNDGSFVGYGNSDRLFGIRIYGGGGDKETLTNQGFLIENCRVRYCIHNISLYDTGVSHDIVIRRNVIEYAYSEESTHSQGIWSDNNQVLVEENFLYHNGWNIQSDPTFYSHSQSSGTHTAGTSSTTLTDNTKTWTATNLVGAVLDNDTTGASGVVTANTATTMTVTLTGGSRQDWQNGDEYSFNAAKMKGQATIFQHNMYNGGGARRGIHRNNILAESSSIAIKLTSNPVKVTGTHTGSNGSAFLEDSTKNFVVDEMVDYGSVTITNEENDETATVTSNTANRIYGTLSGGESWDNGDAYEVEYSTEQRDGTNLTRWGYDFVQHGNVIIEGELSIGAGGNDTYNNGPRWKDFRLYDNVAIDVGDTEPTDRSLGWGPSANDWTGGFVGNNIIVRIGETGVNNVFGLQLSGWDSDLVVSRNFFNDIGLSSGSSSSGSGNLLIQDGTYDNVQIIGNYFRNENTDGKVIGNFPSAEVSGFTFADNNYYTTRTTNEWVDVDDAHDSLADFVTLTGETGSTSNLVTITEARTIETYQTSLSATATKAAFYASCQAQEKSAWDTDYTAERIVAYFKAGYRET